MQTVEFFDKFDDILLTPKCFVLVCHVNPDGDALGSMLAMAEFLRLKGHTVKMVCPNVFPDFFGLDARCDRNPHFRTRGRIV